MSTFGYPKLNPGQVLLSKKEVEYIKHFLSDLTKHKVSSFHSFDIRISKRLVKGLKGEVGKSKLRLSLPTVTQGFETNGIVEEDFEYN